MTTPLDHFRLTHLDASAQIVSFHGRLAWALHRLIEAGDAGCTPIDEPGPRWSAYVHKLRQASIAIESVRERHGGPYPGEHVRYVLRSNVKPINSDDQEVAA